MVGKHLGKHIMLDLEFEPQHKMLTDATIFMMVIEKTIKDHGATVLNVDHHQFGDGGGYTFTYILAESHASCHTWPEHGIATLDIYMCGDCDAFSAMDQFKYDIEHNHGGKLNKFTETKVFRGWVDNGTPTE